MAASPRTNAPSRPTQGPLTPGTGAPTPASSAGSSALPRRFAPTAEPASAARSTRPPTPTLATARRPVAQRHRLRPRHRGAPFDAGVTCDMCGAPASGNPVALTQSGLDGASSSPTCPWATTFRWSSRLAAGAARSPSPRSPPARTRHCRAEQTRMPRNRSRGRHPAHRHGHRRRGLDRVRAAQDGHRRRGVHQPRPAAAASRCTVASRHSSGHGASDPTGTAPRRASSRPAPARSAQYDLVIFACVGDEEDSIGSSDQNNVIDYATAGGRVYATHYSYVWLYNDPPFWTTASWARQPTARSRTHGASRGEHRASPRARCSSQWLQIVGASTVAGPDPSSTTLRNDFSGVTPPSQNWLSCRRRFRNATTAAPLHLQHPGRRRAGTQCGRVVFSDFHVENAQLDAGAPFPPSARVAPLTPQEKVLEFMLFDLASCVAQTAPSAPSCTPLTCAPAGLQLRRAGRRLRRQHRVWRLQQRLLRRSRPGVCSLSSCVPLTCAEQNSSCGPTADGCGNILQCGGCDAGTCGGGGTANQCGTSTFE